MMEQIKIGSEAANEKEKISSIASGAEKINDDLEERIKNEQIKAREEMAELIQFVEDRYRKPDSDLANQPEQLKSFGEHNGQILDYCIEQGLKRGLGDKELKQLEWAAVLHDFCKGDGAPDWAEGIDKFMVVYHGEAAAQALENEPMLKERMEKSFGSDDTESLQAIQKAIRSHMGPHPGFMTFMLNNINNQLEQRGLPKIIHERPEPGDAVAEVLLAADMAALASEKGVEKILTLRNGGSFRKQDENVCIQYHELGLKLIPAEAALMSAFDSAEAACNMINNPEDKKWITGLMEAAKQREYIYKDINDNGETREIRVDFNSVEAKRRTYNDAKMAEELREQIREAA